VEPISHVKGSSREYEFFDEGVHPERSRIFHEVEVLGSGTHVIEVTGLTLRFGGLNALTNVTLAFRDREIAAVIGPNGAGKTSLFNCLTGFYRPQAGTITFNGQDITRLPSHKIAAMGIARTFQNIALYSGLTTLENILAARHVAMKTGFIAGGIFFGSARREEVQHRKVVEEIIDFLEIQAIRKQVVANLPYGMRKRVDLARALALEPKVLLLDEPMAGMNVEEKEDMARFIIDINEMRKIPIILVEHDMALVMDIADRVVVLDFGVKIAEGDPESIVNNRSVISAYLGLKETAFAVSGVGSRKEAAP
jgi:branched-chain amino acid transport system ATP-binding protein